LVIGLGEGQKTEVSWGKGKKKLGEGGATVKKAEKFARKGESCV